MGSVECQLGGDAAAAAAAVDVVVVGVPGVHPGVGLGVVLEGGFFFLR